MHVVRYRSGQAKRVSTKPYVKDYCEYNVHWQKAHLTGRCPNASQVQQTFSQHFGQASLIIISSLKHVPKPDQPMPRNKIFGPSQALRPFPKALYPEAPSSSDLNMRAVALLPLT